MAIVAVLISTVSCGTSSSSGSNTDAGGATASGGSGGSGATTGGASSGGSGNAAGGGAGSQNVGGAPTLLPRNGHIAAGDYLTCVITDLHAIRCWGPTSSRGPSTGTWNHITANAAGDGICALADTGTLSCWNGVADNPPATTFTDASMGSNYACGVQQSDGHIACWTDTAGTPPTAPAESFSQVFSTSSFSCGTRSSDGSVACWPADYLSTSVGDVSGVYAQVAVLSGTVCLLADTGELTCVGHGNNGETTVPSGRYVQVAGGHNAVCALRADRSPVCWGLGDMVGNELPGPFVEIAVGEAHACGIRPDGSVECWGTLNGSLPPPTDVKALVE